MTAVYVVCALLAIFALMLLTAAIMMPRYMEEMDKGIPCYTAPAGIAWHQKVSRAMKVDQKYHAILKLTYFVACFGIGIAVYAAARFIA